MSFFAYLQMQFSSALFCLLLRPEEELFFCVCTNFFHSNDLRRCSAPPLEFYEYYR